MGHLKLSHFQNQRLVCRFLWALQPCKSRGYTIKDIWGWSSGNRTRATKKTVFLCKTAERLHLKMHCFLFLQLWWLAISQPLKLQYCITPLWDISCKELGKIRWKNCSFFYFSYELLLIRKGFTIFIKKRNFKWLLFGDFYLI